MEPEENLSGKIADGVEDAGESVEKAAETSSEMIRKWGSLVANVSGGMLALTAAAFAASLSLSKFRTAYEISKKNSS